MALLELTTVLPFFFILALVYGSLEVSNVFKNKGVKAIIAVVLAFFAASSEVSSQFILLILPYAAFFFVGFFVLSFILTFFKNTGGEKNLPLLLVVITFVVLFFANQNSIGIINIEDQNFLGMIILLGIVILLLVGSKIKE